MRVPVYPAVREKRTRGWVPVRYFNLNLMLNFFLMAVLRSMAVLVIGLVVQLFLIWLFRFHPKALSDYLIYRQQADVYRPWVSAFGWIRNRRPIGFNRL